MKKTKFERAIKIYPKVRVLNGKLLSRSFYQTSQIRLEGNYLTEAGFMPHIRIKVKVSRDSILITKL